MPLRCAQMKRNDGTSYVFCSGKKDGKPAKKDGKPEKKDKPKKKDSKPEKLNKRMVLDDNKGERYDFRVKFNGITNTKRHKIFLTIQKKQGDRNSISMEEIVKVVRPLLLANEQSVAQVRSYITNKGRNQGFVQKYGVKKL